MLSMNRLENKKPIKYEKFSVVIEFPNSIEIHSIVNQDGKDILVKNIRSIEYIKEKTVLVSGDGKII
jgi:hypothetical protein